jgi:hypothetical protein
MISNLFSDCVENENTIFSFASIKYQVLRLRLDGIRRWKIWWSEISENKREKEIALRAFAFPRKVNYNKNKQNTKLGSGAPKSCVRIRQPSLKEQSPAI